MGLSYETAAAERPLPKPPERGGDWATWAAEQRPPAQFLSTYSGPRLFGFDSHVRLGGVIVQPAEVVLGIRAWDDAFEGVIELDGIASPVPYALFEVEKIVRMMLHQSGLAFEILASPAVLHDDAFPARRIVDAAITRNILHHYRDVASGWMARLVETRGQGAEPADALDVVRNALTGRALVDGRAAFDVWELVGDYGEGGLEELLRELQTGVEPAAVDALREHVDGLLAQIDPDVAKLPESPRDYDWLNDFVVSSRSVCSKRA
ncbi:hypothetical protein FIV42_24215 [Persicimonas caeni]|uniref:Uncharacterized protein n=1 Tax=Persicimonas caeni TaxID=2292766 RepID=A0A4Y6PZJ4_PERCE|nr:nucleotidyltransferase domain-containing protein [Persicimonas caeni]QDG53734.1 hypothetical protein FIV42_24215 [Persicimonas caeni]QED34955.1 hypothetical protein FRD00_24210 [Persicimonas caeni]